MKTIKYILLTGVVMLFAISCANAKKPINGIIITGQNNHNWPVSYQALKMTLENSGLFRIDVAVSPKEGEDMKDFSLLSIS